MLNFTSIQANEHYQEDVFTAVQDLDVEKDLEMDALDAMNIAKKNALYPGMNTMGHGSPRLGSKLRLTRLARRKKNENLSKRFQILRS